MTLRWRPVAVSSGAATASNVRRCCCFFFYFLPVNNFSLSLPMFPFSPSPSSVLSQSVFFFRMFFFLPSLSFVLSLPLSLFCFSFFFLFCLCPLPLLSSFTSAFGVLFIEPKAWLCTTLMGSNRLVGHWCDCQGPAPPLGFLVGAWWVVGHCVRSVGSKRESGRQNSKKKASLFPSSPLRDRGEEDEQCRSKRHRSALSLFFFS